MGIFGSIFLSSLSFVLLTAPQARAASASWCGPAVSAAAPTPIDQWLDRHPTLFHRLPEKLHVTVVIPVYRELKNGNLYRLLQAFAKQDADSGRYSIVFVVNNSPDIATEKTPVWRENVATVNYLKWLEKKEVPLSGDVVTMNAVLDKNFSLSVLDRTTPGLPRNIGAFRDMGADHAMYLHTGSYRDLVVSHFDADSIPPPEYISDLLRAFSDPNVNSALFYLKFKIPRGSPPEIHSTFYRTRADYQLQDLHFALTRRNPIGGGPRIATRGSHLRATGGVPHLDNAEDVALIINTGGPSRAHRALWRHPVLTSDRMRTDGYDAASRALMLNMALRENRARDASITANYNTVSEIYEDLCQRVSEQERKLLDQEVEYWRDFHRAQARYVRQTCRQRSRAQEIPIEAFDDPWETVETAAFWDEPGKALALDWSDYAEGDNGKLSKVMETNAMATALSRFLQLGREHPASLPAVEKYLSVRELAFEIGTHSRFLQDENREEYKRTAILKGLSRTTLDTDDRFILSRDSIMPLSVTRDFARLGQLLLEEIPRIMTRDGMPIDAKCRYAHNASFVVENMLHNSNPELGAIGSWKSWSERVKSDPEALAIMTLSFPQGRPLEPGDLEILRTAPQRNELRARLEIFAQRLSLNAYKSQVLREALAILTP